MYKVMFEIFEEEILIYKSRPINFNTIKSIFKYFRNNMDRFNNIIIDYKYKNVSDIIDYMRQSLSDSKYHLRLKINNKFFNIKLVNIKEYQRVLLDMYGWRLYNFSMLFENVKILLHNSYID